MGLKESAIEAGKNVAEVALSVLEHTLIIITFMGGIYLVGLAALYLLSGHDKLKDLVSFIEEGVFLILLGLISWKTIVEAYKRWFPNGFPFNFTVA